MIGYGKDKGGLSASGAQSWRELAGPRRKRVNSPQARKRRRQRWLKIVASLVVLVFVPSAIAWWGLYLKDREEKIQISPPSKPIERILFNTNGVLPNTWLSSVVDIRPGMTMMEADIHELKQQLEAAGQVKTATLERIFPSDLRISVTEHIPVMRLAVQGKDGHRRQRIVARDGTVYEGVGYPRAALQNLPFVKPYRHPAGGYFPMQGIEHVAELLELARQERPELFSTWQVVSLEHYSGDSNQPGEVIEIRSKLVPRIIFGASGAYDRQLDRLVYILDYVQNRGNPSIERIDLSLRAAAAVQFSSGRIGTF